MGFIYFKATKAVHELLADTMKAMIRVTYPDDQQEFNDVIARSYSLSYQSKGKVDYRNSTSPDTGLGRTPNGTMFNVTLLPHDTFRRLCEGVNVQRLQQRAIVLHCFGSKNATQKSVSTAKAGAWGLKEDFEKYPMEGTLDEYLGNISSFGSLNSTIGSMDQGR
jgi:hypothetical protein